MDIYATAKYVRVSQRKMTLLVGSIKELSPEVALQKLQFTNKSGALPLSRVIASALANAKNKNQNAAPFVFKTIEVVSGGAMKRFRAVSRGMAHTYKKRMSHIKVVLTEKKSNNQIPNTKQIQNSNDQKIK